MEENNNVQSGEEQELSKHDRNIVMREQKQKTRENEIRIKKIKSWIPWIIFFGVVVGIIYWGINAVQKDNASRPGEAIPVIGAEHINLGDEHEPYNSNPPTSGSHAEPAPWGFSEEKLIDENLIHNLEHGGIWISYKDLDEQSIEVLREIARKNSRSVVVSPREANDSPVAVASWGRLMKLDSVNEAVIVEFIRKNKNKSPERLVI